MSKQLFKTYILVAATLLAGCNSNEPNRAKELDAEGSYFDYQVWGDEESGNVTVKLQYRSGGPTGATVVLENPARVELDGEELSVDSSRRSGVWYEIEKPGLGFQGEHEIVYTDSDKKQYREVFEYTPFSLKTAINGEVRREDLVFELDGLNPTDYIQVLLTDTSYYSRGIDRVDTVKNGRVLITRDDLENLKSGPVSIEFYRDEERTLKEVTSAGGRLSISYGLKRVFNLHD